jgi:hypothetical protein
MPSEIQEALTAAGASNLVPKIIDKSLLEYQRRYAPVIAAIPSFKWDTDYYFFNRRSVNPAGGAVVDGGARPMTNSQYDQFGWQMKHTQIIGGVTGYAQAVTSTQVQDLLGKELDGALKGHYWDLETQAMWGNSAATLNNGAPQYDGFDSLVSNYSGSDQNAIDWSGAPNSGALTLLALDQLADMVESNSAMDVFGSHYMFLCSNTAMSQLAHLLQAQQRFEGRVEVAAGLLVPTYRDIPIVKSSFLASRAYAMGTIVPAASGAGGTMATGTYYYRVSAVVARQGELVASAAGTNAAVTGPTGSVTISFSTPTGYEGGQPILYKVYRGSASGSETLLGVVDAQVGVAADGITPVATTSIVDTGTALIPKNGGTAPGTPLSSYVGGNAAKKPLVAGEESIYLVPRDEDYLCRPYVREAQRLNVATTVAAPDTMPFVLQTDTTLALRGTKFIGALTKVNTKLQ